MSRGRLFSRALEGNCGSKQAVVESHAYLRLISLLPVLPSIFERVIYRYIINHVNKFCIVPERQSGFRKTFAFLSASWMTC